MAIRSRVAQTVFRAIRQYSESAQDAVPSVPAAAAAAATVEPKTGAASGVQRKETGFLNEVRLLGRVGRDPELRGQAKTTCVFPLATKSVILSNGAIAEKVEWHRIAVYLPRLRDYVQGTVTKGDRVLVLGSLRYNEYLDERNVKRMSTSIVANNVINLTYRLREGEQSNEEDVVSDATATEIES